MLGATVGNLFQGEVGEKREPVWREKEMVRSGKRSLSSLTVGFGTEYQYWLRRLGQKNKTSRWNTYLGKEIEAQRGYGTCPGSHS